MIQTSYDIIKAHGGEIKVETKEGESAEFIIELPVVWTMIYGLKDSDENWLYKSGLIK